MYYGPNMYQHQYQNNYQSYVNAPMYNYVRQPGYPSNSNNNYAYQTSFLHPSRQNVQNNLKDFGPNPFVVNINEVTKRNDTFRTALWTGKNLQVTLMSINVGEDIGLENHPNLDQFLRIEQGKGIVQMGRNKENLNYVREVYDDSAILIPAGSWHNLTNTGNVPLKLYSIYAPPQHPRGTIHVTKSDALAAERRI